MPYRKTKRYILNITVLQKCLERVILTNIITLCLDKIARTVNILLTNFRYSIAAYNLNEYKIL